jgi:hypothetical protein
MKDICSKANFQLLKVERMSLSLASKFENVAKIIFLIRDPRAVMHSRMECHWGNNSLFINTKILCQQYLNDYITFKVLQQRSPEKFMLVLPTALNQVQRHESEH